MKLLLALGGALFGAWALVGLVLFVAVYLDWRRADRRSTHPSEGTTCVADQDHWR